jgi:hypothetical protein
VIFLRLSAVVAELHAHHRSDASVREGARASEFVMTERRRIASQFA